MRSGLNTGTFGVFTEEYDWYLHTTRWMRVKPERVAAFSGIAASVYNLGAAGRAGPVYLAGSFSGLITAYGFWDDTMTDETFSLMAGFGERWSIKFTYFDQNYPGGRGTASPALYTGAVLPLPRGELKASAGVNGAMKFSSGWDIDLILPECSVSLEYAPSPAYAFYIGYTAVPVIAGPSNSTAVSAVPVLHTVSLWYTQAWTILDRLSIGLRFSALTRINPNRLAGNWDVRLSLPLAVRYEAVPDVFEFFAALELGYYYATFDYAVAGGSGGNLRGSVPVTGLALGFTLHMTAHARFQLAAQFEHIPYYSAGSPYNFSVQDLSLASLFSAPLSVSLCFTF